MEKSSGSDRCSKHRPDSAMEIFQQIDPPPKQQRLKISKEATWYTWSRESRLLFKPFRAEVGQLKRPTILHLLGGKEYDDTYTFNLKSIGNKNKGLGRDLMCFARSFYDLKISDRLMLFTDMISPDLDGRSLGFFFAFLRAALVSLSRDPLSALCQSLSTRKKGNEFLLHSDLYIPVILFNVFDDVKNDSSGASLFLSVSSLIELLPQVRSLPIETRKKIVANLTGVHDKDRYEENYYLLHGYEHEWTEELERRMRQRQLKIKLYSGQGYLIHDRKWLHGREALNGKLSSKRLHRLIFNNRQTQQASRKLKGHKRSSS